MCENYRKLWYTAKLLRLLQTWGERRRTSENDLNTKNKEKKVNKDKQLKQKKVKLVRYLTVNQIDLPDTREITELWDTRVRLNIVQIETL